MVCCVMSLLFVGVVAACRWLLVRWLFKCVGCVLFVVVFCWCLLLLFVVLCVARCSLLGCLLVVVRCVLFVVCCVVDLICLLGG